jgi:hypothetical protein
MMELFRTVFDMLPDVAGILLAALSLSLLFLPRELKVLEAPKWRWLRWTLAAIFAVVGIGGLASNWVQKSQDKKERGELNGKITNLQNQLTSMSQKINTDTNASVGPVDFVPLRGAQSIEEGLFQWDMGFVVTQNTARNMRARGKLQVEYGQGVNDKKIWSKFKGVAIKEMGEHGPDVGIGSAPWGTLNLQLSKRDADAVMAGSKTIYVLALAEWTNPSGSDGHFPLCLWLQKPSGKILTAQNVVWHVCSL